MLCVILPSVYHGFNASGRNEDLDKITNTSHSIPDTSTLRLMYQLYCFK